MASKEPNKSNSLTVYRKVYSALDNNDYYGYLTEKHYHPSKANHRAEASRAFMVWYLTKKFPKEKLNILKEHIVDASSDEGIDAVCPVSNNWEENGCENIFFYQAKFYEVDVDEDTIKNMRKLWKKVRKGEDGFEGEIYNKLDFLDVFTSLENDGVKVHFVLVITTKLTKDGKTAFDKLASDIQADQYLDADLTLVDESKLIKYL